MQLHSLVGGAAEIIGPEATLASAAAGMIDESVDCLAVVDGRNLVGILTERDLVIAICDGVDPEDEVVRDWMSEAPDTFAPDVMVREAAAWLLETGYRHLPVMAEGELLGIVSIRDLLWALAQGS
jgi:CBS domain-containing protein